MSVEDAKSSMSTFVFPDTDTQLSQSWLGVNAQTFMKGVADVFVNAGSIDSAKGSYADNVNTGPLVSAKDM
jgi:taurine transport system substrate-binding protein